MQISFFLSLIAPSHNIIFCFFYFIINLNINQLRRVLIIRTLCNSLMKIYRGYVAFFDKTIINNIYLYTCVCVYIHI